MNKRKIGADYEEAACSYLREKGYQILERNFRCRYGEIDIIAKDRNYIVFIEVKYRRDIRKGEPLEAVTRGKQKHLTGAAVYYLYTMYFTDAVSCRFDVIGINGDSICHVENAFEVC